MTHAATCIMAIVRRYISQRSFVQWFNEVFSGPMYRLIRDAWRSLVRREHPKLHEEPVGNTAESWLQFEQLLRDAARKRLQQGHPESGEPTPLSDTCTRDSCRRRVQQQYPNLQPPALDEIVEDVACVYRSIKRICRSREQRRHPKLDEIGVEVLVMLTSIPPIKMVENALFERIHLCREKRVQEVAIMITERL